MIIKNCLQCGKEYRTKNNLINSSHYCSRECNNKSKIGKPSWNKGLITKVKVNCSYCDKELMVQKKKSKTQENFFCNNSHRGLYFSGDKNPKYKGKNYNCIDCGKERDWSNNLRCKKCSNKFLRGKNHPNYKDGSSSLKRNYSYDYKLWRMSVFERDWFTCQYPGCGYKGKDIQAHHIKRAKEHPELLLEKDNGITLCKEHHNKTRCKEKYYEKLFNEIIKLWK